MAFRGVDASDPLVCVGALAEARMFNDVHVLRALVEAALTRKR